MAGGLKLLLLLSVLSANSALVAFRFAAVAFEGLATGLALFASLTDASLLGALGLGGSTEAPKEIYAKDDPMTDYGVDVSYPIHHNLNLKSENPVIRMHAERYDKMIKGCYAAYSYRECDSNERARLEMSFEQPSTQVNYTEIGFKKMRAPEGVWKPLIEFWEENKLKEKAEQWPRGNTYVNNWEVASYMVNFEDKSLRGGFDVKKIVWDAAKPILEEWTGKKLEPTSLYGVRVYKNGAVLATHVDRLPLVSSAIIQVAQDIDEPWPVEVYSHDGRAHNVTMKPGDMVLYESHTVLHGRPFPLKGKFYANVFVHFQPIDHDENNEKLVRERAKNEREKSGGHEHDQHDAETLRRHAESHDKEEALKSAKAILDLQQKWKRDTNGDAEKEMRTEKKKRGKRGEDEEEDEEEEEEDGEEEGEEEEEDVDRAGPAEIEADFGEEDKEDMEIEEQEEADGRTEIHRAAADGDIEGLERLLSTPGNSDMLHARDLNDWQAVHEAARAGQLEALKYLIDRGADVGSKTNSGGTALWWAKKSLPADHEVIVYLQSINAPEGGEEDTA